MWARIVYDTGRLQKKKKRSVRRSRKIKFCLWRISNGSSLIMHCRVRILLCIRAWVKACQCRQCTALLRELPVATELCLRWVWPYQWLRLLSHWFPGLLPALRSLGWAGVGGGVLRAPSFALCPFCLYSPFSHNTLFPFGYLFSLYCYFIFI